MKKTALALILFLAGGALFAGGSGSSSKPLDGSYPIVLSHGMFGWGEDTSGAIGIIDYWGGMDEYLRTQGAVVYAPAKAALDSNEARAEELKEKTLYFMAANGYSKVNIIGHSQGGLDSRYMVSNLGMASKVATLTTLNTPHKGSPIADLINDVLPSWLQSFAAAVINTLTSIVYGGTEQDLMTSLESLSIANADAFNASTPNASGVRYYSYGSIITFPDLIQHPLMGIVYPACAAGGLFYGVGSSNDGLVPSSSQKWGTWKGGPDYSWYVTGVDHLQATNTLRSGQAWYDVEGYWLDIAKNAKNNQ